MTSVGADDELDGKLWSFIALTTFTRLFLNISLSRMFHLVSWMNCRPLSSQSKRLDNDGFVVPVDEFTAQTSPDIFTEFN